MLLRRRNMVIKKKTASCGNWTHDLCTTTLTLNRDRIVLLNHFILNCKAQLLWRQLVGSHSRLVVVRFRVRFQFYPVMKRKNLPDVREALLRMNDKSLNDKKNHTSKCIYSNQVNSWSEISLLEANFSFYLTRNFLITFSI